MQKKVALLIIVSLLLTMFAVPVTANPTEVTLDMVEDLPAEDHWSYEPMANLVAMGVVKGYPSEVDSDGLSWVKILPDKAITRAEFASMLVQALNLKPKDNAAAPFADVSGWYKEAVDILYDHKITSGYNDQTFRPHNRIKRAEIAAMLAGALHDKGTETGRTFSDVKPEYWGYQPILRVARLGIINGYPDGRFKPEKNATRAEVMSMIYQFMWKDGTQAPEDNTLLEVTDGYISKQLAALSARPVDFSTLFPYTTGEREAMLGSEEEAFEEISDVITMTYEKLEPGKVELRSDRLAQIAYHAKVTMKVKDPDTKKETVVSDDFMDYYLLMKIDDKWLVFSNFDEGLELDLSQPLQ